MSSMPCAPVTAAAPVPTAAGTRRRLRALAFNGWPAAELAARLGITPARLRKLRDTPLTGPGVSTARESLYRQLWDIAPAVAALYDSLWDRRPPQGTRGQRQAATKARRHAADRGWAPPLAWDDDDGGHGIDNAAAVPAPGWRRSGRRPRPAELLEDATWLAATQGYGRAAAAARLGVSRNNLDAITRRAAARSQ